MSDELKGKYIAILATDGFEQAELTEPLKALKAAGATVDVIAPKAGTIRGVVHHEKGESVEVDRALDRADAADYAALVLPGGVVNPDALRINDKAVDFVRKFFEQKKPVAAICHGPWMLVEANAVKGRTLTSWPSLKTDLTNAGGHWTDQEVVVDQGLVTSRWPDDLPAFCKKMIEEFREGEHRTQNAAE